MCTFIPHELYLLVFVDVDDGNCHDDDGDEDDND